MLDIPTLVPQYWVAALLSNTQVIHYNSLKTKINRPAKMRSNIVYIEIPIIPSEMEVALPKAISWVGSDWIYLS